MKRNHESKGNGMKKIMQTRTGKEKGNCLSACIASLLEMPIDIFEIKNENNWLNQLNDVLQPLGYTYAEFDADKPFTWCGECFMIGCGTSPRGLEHAVIVRHFPKDGRHHYEFIHDPHPQGGWLTLKSIGVLLPTWMRKEEK
jgi:hypothetical protein